MDEFVYITDDTYTKRQLLRMEHLLLKVLAFDLTVPTTNQFLLQYLRRQGVCIRTENLAKVRRGGLPETKRPPFSAVLHFCLPAYHLCRDERQFTLRTWHLFTGRYCWQNLGRSHSPSSPKYWRYLSLATALLRDTVHRQAVSFNLGAKWMWLFCLNLTLTH